MNFKEPLLKSERRHFCGRKTVFLYFCAPDSQVQHAEVAQLVRAQDSYPPLADGSASLLSYLKSLPR